MKEKRAGNMLAKLTIKIHEILKKNEVDMSKVKTMTLQVMGAGITIMVLIALCVLFIPMEIATLAGRASRYLGRKAEEVTRWTFKA